MTITETIVRDDARQPTAAGGTAVGAKGPTSPVAYIMSRFPKLTETFVLFEMLALEERGTPVEVFPLLRARNTATHPEGAGLWKKLIELCRRPTAQAVMHPEAAAFAARAHYAPFFSLAILLAQLHYLRTRPAAYMASLWTLIRANWGSANYLLGGLAIFPKAVYFARHMARLKVAHVHAHFANHPAAAAYVIHQLTGIPYSFTAHGADLQVDQHMLVEKVTSAKFVVAISRDNARLIRSVCGDKAAERVKVIRCGVDVRVFLDQPPDVGTDPQRPLQIICTGTLYEVKGHIYLIEACRLLRDRGIAAECHLVGDGPLREPLARHVAELRLGDRVHFHGRLTRAQIAERLRSADVLVAPSVPTAEGRREGIPVVLMEAMACSLPVVASHISGIPELVEHERTGILVPPRDAGAIADALARLARAPSRRVEMGRAGRERVLADFNLEKNVCQLSNLFFDVPQC